MNRRALITLVLLYLGFFTVNFTQYQLTPVADAVMAQYGVSPARFTAIFAAPMLPGVFLALPSGLISDCFGVRRVLVVGLLASACGMVWRIFSSDAASLYGSMLLLGIGMSSLYSNYAKIIRGQVSPERVGVVGAVVLSSCSMGMLVSTATTALLPSLKAAYLTGAVLTVAVFLGFLFLFQEQPPAARNQEEPAFRECFRVALHNRSLWLAALSMLLACGGCNVAAPLLPSAVAAYHHTGAAQAGMLVSVMMVGNLCGTVVWPMLIHRRGGYRLAIAMAALVYGSGVAWAWMLPTGWLMLILFFLVGSALGALCTLLMSLPALLPEIGEKYGGTGGGLICTLQMLGAVVLPAWVLIPLGGDSYRKMFLLAGLLLFIVTALTPFLPRLIVGERVKAKDRS